MMDAVLSVAASLSGEENEARSIQGEKKGEETKKTKEKKKKHTRHI